MVKEAVLTTPEVEEPDDNKLRKEIEDWNKMLETIRVYTPTTMSYKEMWYMLNRADNLIKKLTKKVK